MHLKTVVFFWLLQTAVLCHADTVSTPLRSFGLGDLQVVAMSPDLTRMATAGQAGAYVWDFEAGQVLHTLDAHQSLITALAFSPDGRLLLGAGKDRLIRSWDVATGAPAKTYAAHQHSIESLAFSPDGTRFLSASSDNTARLWSVDSQEVLQTVRVPGYFVSNALFLGDSTRFVTLHGSTNDRVRVWTASTGELVRSLPLMESDVSVICLLPQERVATGGANGRVRIWNLETGEPDRTLLEVAGMIQHLRSTTNGSIVIGTQEGRVRVCDLETGDVRHDFMAEPAHSILWLPGVNHLLFAHTDNTVRLRTLDGSLLRTVNGHTTSTTLGVAFSPNRQEVLSGGVESQSRLWSRTNAELVRTFPSDGAGTSAALFSPGGEQVLTTAGSPQKVARLFNRATGELVREFSGHTGYLLSAAFSPDGRQIVTGATDGTVRVWQTNGESVRVFPTPNSWVRAVAFSRDGRLVAGGGSDSTAQVWNLESGKKLHSLFLNAGSVKTLAFAPGFNYLLVVWEDGILRLFDSESGSPLLEFASPAAFLNCAAFSPDARYILIGEGWPTYVARLLDTETGRVVRVFAGHTFPVESVAFDATGTLVLTGADRVRLWSVADVVSRVSLRRNGSVLELEWNRGALQRSENLAGPWHSVPNAVSPFHTTAEGPGLFFRLSVPVEE